MPQPTAVVVSVKTVIPDPYASDKVAVTAMTEVEVPIIPVPVARKAAAFPASEARSAIGPAL